MLWVFQKVRQGIDFMIFFIFQKSPKGGWKKTEKKTKILEDFGTFFERDFFVFFGSFSIPWLTLVLGPNLDPNVSLLDPNVEKFGHLNLLDLSQGV